jgi:hypothetical protein
MNQFDPLPALSPTKPKTTHLDDDLSTRETIFLLGLAFLAVFLLGALPFVSLINYPFRLLVTLVHELGHGLAAIATGGQFVSFEVSPNGSGLAFTRGGWRFVIIPAGYLSVAIFTALLIISGRSYRGSKRMMIFLGGAMMFFSLFFARPGGFNILQLVSGVVALLVGLSFGALFIWVALRATARTMFFLMHFLALKFGLAALSDIFFLVGLSNVVAAPQTDAHSMAQLTGLPVIFWALMWVAMAALIIGVAVWVTWLDRN